MRDQALTIFDTPVRRVAILLAFVFLAGGCRNKSNDTAPEPVPEKPAPVSSAAPVASPAKAVGPKPAPVPMVRFAAGKFMMGMPGNSIGGDYRDLQPMHLVQVPAFSMDVNEITVTQYRACVDAGECSGANLTGDKKRDALDGCNWDLPGYEDDPINCLPWDQADVYCKWVGKELPTEEMWEYAAGGPKKRDFPWGMGVPGELWGTPKDDSDYVGGGCDYESKEQHPARIWRRASTCPIGSRPKADTPEGIKDMAGNVSEWTSSMHCPYDKKQCDTKERVVRGGHISDHRFNYRVVTRRGEDPSTRDDLIGFRCAKREDG